MNALQAISSTVGALELIMAAVALYYSTKSPVLKWLKYFALGLTLLAFGHISFLKDEVRIVLTTAGLIIMLTSLLSALGFRRLKAFAIMALVLGALYATSKCLTLKPFDEIAEVLFFTVLPVVVAYEVYSLYEDTKRIGVFLFFLGLVIYALATDIRLVMLVMRYPYIKAVTAEMLSRMIGVAMMLGGFLLA